MMGPVVPESYRKLCILASEADVHIELTVEDGRPLGAAGREYRLLERIRIRETDGQVLAEQRIVGNSIEAAANHLIPLVSSH